MAGLVGGDVEGAVGDAARRLDRLVLPIAVLAVPLIFGIDAQQLPAEPRLGHRLAVGRHHDHVEARNVLVAERAAGEERLHPDHGLRWRDRQRDLALDGSAAGLRHAECDLGLQRMGRGRHLVERHGELRLARGVGLRQIGQGRAFGFCLLVILSEAEDEARKARPIGGLDHMHLAFEVEA